MSDTKLRGFVGKALARKRIGFGDVRRLQRDILPAGLTGREDAEALLGLDQAVSRADPAWADYLATAVKDLALAGGGGIDRDTAEWLVAVLSRRPRTGLAIAREIVLEARAVDGVLLAFVEGARGRARHDRAIEEPAMGQPPLRERVLPCEQIA
ncbi:hypothetical protein [Salinarimonas soli]|uniref:Uncharacterized protein n=1 Tax=Salinarimonas soli TaxID=1638099 RepID=A0A5B2W1B7_9HYPH|nr:hypothetical protein [Salinarimonas soli]KAA2244009.1 hypothetical protein F0L46_01815 [Salinarimonas soli]